jgi:hypothetical protein
MGDFTPLHIDLMTLNPASDCNSFITINLKSTCEDSLTSFSKCKLYFDDNTIPLTNEPTASTALCTRSDESSVGNASSIASDIYEDECFDIESEVQVFNYRCRRAETPQNTSNHLYRGYNWSH